MGIALLHDDAAIHENDLVRHVPGESHFVGDDDHGGLLIRQVADDSKDLAGQLGVQCGGGFVEAENIRVHGQCPGDGYPLLLAAGELVRVVVCPVSQPHLLQKLPAFRFNLLFALTAPLLRQQLPG